MAMRQREERAASAGECRQCRSFCDKLVEPRGCVEMGCRYLYSYLDPFSGRAFMGCLHKVFRSEVDVLAVLEPGGFGGIKVTGTPLPHCQFQVERSYEGTGSAYSCVNPRFFDCADSGPEGLRAFDLREGLREL
jgi:hypothetical protein